MTTETALGGLPDLRQEAHPDCVVCDPKSESGLCLEFATLKDGSVEAYFDCDSTYKVFRACCTEA